MAISGQLDLFIQGGRVVTTQGVSEANIGIQNGKIAILCEPGLRLPARRTIDASGRHILPGIIDPHVHMTNNNRTMEESCHLDMPSMAIGGITTILDFSKADDSYLPVWERDRAAVNAHALLDVGFHGIVMTEQHIEELPRYAQEFGVTSYKMFMAAKGAQLYPGTLSLDDGNMCRAFRMISRLTREGFPTATAMVHAENWEIAWALAEDLKRAGRTDPAAWSDSRPGYINEESIRRVIFLAHQHDCPLYIVHCPIGNAGRIVAAARARGARVHGETCPHYLTLHRTHDRALHGTYNPAIQTTADIDGLWRSLIDGSISAVGSDHIPVQAKDKTVVGKNIWTVRGGAPGSGLILPMLLTHGFHERAMSLERLVEVSSTNAAKIFGLFPRKGVIAVGADADLVLVDLEREITLRPELMHLDWVLHDGWSLKGWPTMTLVRGQVIVEDGEIVAKPGVGRYIRDVAPVAAR